MIHAGLMWKWRVSFDRETDFVFISFSILIIRPAGIRKLFIDSFLFLNKKKLRIGVIEKGASNVIALATVNFGVRPLIFFFSFVANPTLFKNSMWLPHENNFHLSGFFINKYIER